MITTIVLFELTVASHQRMTVKNRCLYSVTSLESPDTGRKKVEAKWLAGTLKTEVAPSSRQWKREARKSVVGQGSWQTEPKPVLQVEEDKKISRTRRSQVLQPSTKNSIKSISPSKRKYSPQELHQRKKISKLWDHFSLYPILYTLSLSLSIWRKMKEKKKDSYVHGLFIDDIFDTLKVYIFV